ncbi:MAG: SDR family oxidoreductase [Betaproteobacteria bacterium]|nr:SDR family oxidoreductase [Betaproteobacteria bacterium]NCV60554.1 SDR family oxidoreductase [Betaproteobacteria bacterium]NCZ28618.1 SDR family oxidoreductase [Betaproteobacteria bacterium]NDF73134.1 SDR family oxidoreductase [Betaproteobacteria bacterium]
MSAITTTLITGGSRGIGLEIARLLASRGHRLLLVSRDSVRLNSAAQELRQAYGAEVHSHAIDLSEPGATKTLVLHTEQKSLRIDCLVNNAGFGMVDEHVDIDPNHLHRMLQLNVVAVAELCQVYGALMKQRRDGRILNIASTAAFQPTPYFAAYGASKSFVLNFSEALAKEMEDYGVSVSCLAPGPTDTAFFDGVDPQRIDGGHFFRKSARADPSGVAQQGVELMLRGGMTHVVGAINRFMILGNRLAPRPVVAAISKHLLRPAAVKSDTV